MSVLDAQRKVEEIAARFGRASGHSDMDDASLRRVIAEALLASESHPGAPLLEIGTRRGGSARAVLEALAWRWAEKAPLLVTVDPYGEKPYAGGEREPDGVGCRLVSGIYGNEDYVAAKRLLADFPNHAHFRTTGAHFLNQIAPSYFYWEKSGEHRLDFCFAFLDGEHALPFVQQEVYGLWSLRYMGWWKDKTRRPVILLDNVDKDPKLLAWLMGDIADPAWDWVRALMISAHEGRGAGQEHVLVPVEILRADRPTGAWQAVLR